jgi:tRNA (cytidine/uridine-2'-O-)-methyltransferase
MTPALALYQPDIAGNTGTLIRLCACLGSELHIIEPAGFRDDDTALKRSGMDYVQLAAVTRHADFAAFETWRKVHARRLVLLTVQAKTPYHEFAFSPSDILLLGRESAGVPESVHAASDDRIRIAMVEEARSINQAVSGAIVLAEALRQTGTFPSGTLPAA